MIIPLPVPLPLLLPLPCHTSCTLLSCALDAGCWMFCDDDDGFVGFLDRRGRRASAAGRVVPDEKDDGARLCVPQPPPRRGVTSEKESKGPQLMAASRATTAAAAATAYPAAGPAEASSSIHQAEYTDPAASTSAAPMDWEAAEQAGGRASAPPSESRPPSWFHLAVRGYAARHVSSSPAPAPSPAAPSSTLPGEDLATEILPAPPRLPYDARYPALAPHAEGSNRKRLVGVPGPGSEGPVPYGLPAFAATAAATGPRFSRGRNGAKSVKVK